MVRSLIAKHRGSEYNVIAGNVHGEIRHIIRPLAVDAVRYRWEITQFRLQLLVKSGLFVSGVG